MPLGLLLAATLTGCATVKFYAQAAYGQTALLLSRRDVQAVLADGHTRPELTAQLRLAVSLLRFAEEELALPVEGRYRTYVELAGFPVWNVVAAQELALAAVPRCYPLVGCVIYRGFFAKRAAEREAARLAVEHDVQLYPVVAYSTLGWFDDPLLSSFIHFAEADLAELLFHELAHGVVYLRDDSTFNESFASFVGAQGAVAWLAANGEDAPTHRRAQRTQRRAARDFGRFLAHWRNRLDALYRQPIDDAAKRLLKTEAFRAMRTAYRACRDQLGNGRYDNFMEAPLNNARLVSFGAYDDLREGFARVFRATGGEWPRFFERVRELGNLPKTDRHAALAAEANSAPVCGGAARAG